MRHRLLIVGSSVVLAAGCPGDAARNPSWQPLGGAIEGGTRQQQYRPSVALDPTTRNPLVAVQEAGPDGVSTVRVMAWDGGTWNPLGPRVNAAGNNTNSTAIAVDRDGTPWVAWSDRAPGSVFGFHLLVASWDGDAWIQRGLDLGLVPEPDVHWPSIAIDDAGAASVAWSEPDQADAGRHDVALKQWNGSDWATLGESFDSGPTPWDTHPTVVIGTDGNPVVAWDSAPDGGGGGVIVTRWNGATWDTLGAALDEGATSLGRLPSLAIAGDELYLAFNGGRIGGGIAVDDLHVKHWDGAAWSDVGEVLDIAVEQLVRTSSIAVDGAGRPVVAWSEQGPVSNDVWVKRWTGTEWQQLEGPMNESNGSNPIVAIGAGDQPLVVWEQGAVVEEPPHVLASQWTGD